MCFIEVVIFQGFKNQKGFAREGSIPKRGYHAMRNVD